MKMTSRFALVLALAMLFSGVAFGQLGIKKGIKGGLNIATVSLEQDGGIDISSRTAFAAGLFLEIDPPVFPLSLEVDALFSQKGYKSTYETVLGTTQELTANLNYLDIPVLAKFSIPIAPTASYHVVAGPQMSFKLGEKFESDGNEIESDEDDFKGNEFSLVFGLGVEMNALISSVAIDIRYALGLSDISESYTIGTEEFDTSDKNRVIQVLVGIGF
ncbi:MAG TPA: porin family protein [Calditrichia bacterium]|nr:porin family protein [Calditrichia bacterium]HQV30779.1 porin family protein [Calditrichia bacterium]